MENAAMLPGTVEIWIVAMLSAIIILSVPEYRSEQAGNIICALT